MGSTLQGYDQGVFVWQWVQQHRLLSVLVLALVIVSSAGGTAWALVFRTVSSPVGLREALRIYRREQTGKVVATLRDRLPAPGVYMYRTQWRRGPEPHGCPARLPLELLHDRGRRTLCDRELGPITQHTEATTVCAGPDGSLSVPRLVTDESIAGTTTTSTVRCPATAYLLPPTVRPALRWAATCSLTSPAEKITLAGVALGPATMAVGGHEVAVEHTRLTLTFTGTDGGTNPTDFWIVPSSGLIVREHETVGVTQGGVRYSESMDAMLTGARPDAAERWARRRAHERRQPLGRGQAVALGDHFGHLVPVGRGGVTEPDADPALGPDVLRARRTARGPSATRIACTPSGAFRVMEVPSSLVMTKSLSRTRNAGAVWPPKGRSSASGSARQMARTRSMRAAPRAHPPDRRRAARRPGRPVLRHRVVGGVVGAGVVGELELEQPGLAPRLAQVAVVGVEQAELADVRHQLGEEAAGELAGLTSPLAAASIKNGTTASGRPQALPDLGRGGPGPRFERGVDAGTPGGPSARPRSARRRTPTALRIPKATWRASSDMT